MDNFINSTIVKTKYKEIVESGVIPKNLTWIMLIPIKPPGKYTVSDEVDDTLPKNVTLMDLRNCGLLIRVYFHPYNTSYIILLPLLQPIFMLAKHINKNIYELLDTGKETHYCTELKEIDSEMLNDIKILS